MPLLEARGLGVAYDGYQVLWDASIDAGVRRDRVPPRPERLGEGHAP